MLPIYVLQQTIAMWRLAEFTQPFLLVCRDNDVWYGPCIKINNNNKLYEEKTNTTLFLPSNTYFPHTNWSGFNNRFAI